MNGTEPEPGPFVYLAGGMRPWRERVIDACSHLQVRFLDPTTHGLTDEEDYTWWDLQAASASDCIFAYMHKDNPGGHGLMLELGSCAGPMWYKIFCEDPGDDRTRHYGMARVLSDECFTDLDEAIEALKTWIEKFLD